MKKGIRYLGLGLMAFSLLLARVDVSRAATADATLLFNISNTSVAVGDNFNLIARINPGSNTTNGVNAVQLDIVFDETVLQLNSITASSPFAFAVAPDSAAIAAANSSGTLSVPLFIGGSQIVTTANIATLNFHAQAETSPTSSVSFVSSADAAVSDGSGTLVVSTRTPATITVAADALTTYTIGGTISGLAGTAVLQNNDGDNLSISANGSFTFATPLNDTSSYDVSVLTQPSGQTCNVTNGVGILSGANITNVSISCADTQAPTVSGGSPTGTLAVDTTGTNIVVATDENATCKYATSSGVAYDAMTSGVTPLAMSHSFSITGLSNGGSYGYFVRCKDVAGNSSGDYLISFAVATPPVVVPPQNDDNNSNGDDSKSSSKEKHTPAPARAIYNSKTKVARGAVLYQRGKNFSKNTLVLLYFSRYGGGYYPPIKIKTSYAGTFLASYRANKPKGTYYWYAVDTKTGKKSKTIYYRIRN